ncbi:MAG: hypothetical protein JKX81_19750, partial [Arenicella sp.]|nr:hypothetical protein [Arenicella sp.]
MDAFKQLGPQLQQLWINLSALEQSVLAIMSTMLTFYLVRFVVLRRLEVLAAKTDNDFDDRLIHFLKQFLWLVALFSVVVWVMKING